MDKGKQAYKFVNVTDHDGKFKDCELFGHYHENREINEQEVLLYDDIIQIV